MPVFDPGVPWLRGTATLTNGSTTVTTDGVITLNEILEGDRLYVMDGGERIGPFEIVGGEGDEIELREPFEGATGSYSIAIDRNPITRTGAKVLRDMSIILRNFEDQGPLIEEVEQARDEAVVAAASAGYVFQTVAEVQSRHIPPVLESIRTNGYYVPGDGGGALYVEGDEGPGAIQSGDGRWWELGETEVTPAMFGAIPDYNHGNGSGTDNTERFQAMFSLARARGLVINFPRGRWLCEGEVDVHPTGAYQVRGVSSHETRLYFRRPSHTDVGFRATNTADVTNRGRPMLWSNLSIRGTADNRGTLFEYRNSAGFVTENLHVFCEKGAEHTAVRLSGCWNCDIRGLQVWNAGCNRPAKVVPYSTTFSIAKNGTTLTASAAGTFSPDDVGLRLTLQDSSSFNVGQVFTIDSYFDDQTVEVSEPAFQDFSGNHGQFCGVAGTIVNGSNKLTLQAPALSAADVGRVIYVVGVGDFVPGGARRPLRTTIVEVDGTTVTLADNAQASNNSPSPLVVSPAVEIAPVDGDDDSTNDLKMPDLMIERYAGCGLVIDQASRVSLPDVKIHGTPPEDWPTPIQSGVCHALFSYAEVFVPTGDLTQHVSSAFGGIIVTGSNGRFQPTLGDINYLPVHGIPLIYSLRNINGSALVPIGNIGFSGDNVTQEAMGNLLGGSGLQVYSYGARTGSQQAPIRAIETLQSSLEVGFPTLGDASITYNNNYLNGQIIHDWFHWYVDLSFTVTDLGATSGSLQISGMPFKSSVWSAGSAEITFLGGFNLPNDTVSLGGWISRSTGVITLRAIQPATWVTLNSTHIVPGQECVVLLNGKFPIDR